MKLSKDNNNNIKYGRVWLYLDKRLNKVISLEWSLNFNLLNFYISLNGNDNSYTLCFWFIFTFYITFTDIFTYYPKEWNSITNNGKGGYINSAVRKIGISQYNWSLSLYIWHDGGDDIYYEDKDDKIWFRWINLLDELLGSFSNETIEEYTYTEYFYLNEGKVNVKVKNVLFKIKYKRIYARIFNRKFKTLTLISDIKYPYRKQTEDDISDIKKYNLPQDGLERNISDKFYNLKSNTDNNIIIDKYKKHIIELRSCESKYWVPFVYRKKIEREKKLNKLLK